MDKSNLQQGLLVAAASGLAGFFILFAANFIVLFIALGHISIVCCSGPYSFSLWENLIVLGFVPLLIILGVLIPAWALDTKWQAGVFAGLISVGIIVIIQIYGDPNYSPYNDRETLQFIAPVCVIVLISIMTRKDRFFLGKLAIFFLTLILFGLKSLISVDEIDFGGVSLKIGLVISFLTWIILPSATALFSTTNPKMET